MIRNLIHGLDARTTSFGFVLVEGSSSGAFETLRLCKLKIQNPLWKADSTDLKAQFNFEKGGLNSLPGSALVAYVRAVFGTGWRSRPGGVLNQPVDANSGSSRLYSKTVLSRHHELSALRWICLLYTSPSPRD